jgi:hypothetical protein
VRANTGGPNAGLPYLHGSLAEKFEKLRAGLSLRGDQLEVLFGGEIPQDAAMTDFEFLPNRVSL